MGKEAHFENTEPIEDERRAEQELKAKQREYGILQVQLGHWLNERDGLGDAARLPELNGKIVEIEAKMTELKAEIEILDNKVKKLMPAKLDRQSELDHGQLPN